MSVKQEQFTLNIGTESELVIKPQGNFNVIFTVLTRDSTYSKNLNIRKTFNFCDDLQEIVDLTFFTLKNRNFTAKLGKKELTLCINYNLGFKKKTVTIVLKNTCTPEEEFKKEISAAKEEIRREINVAKSEFDHKYRKLSDFYNDEISTLNKYCEGMFKYILDMIQDNSLKNSMIGEKNKFVEPPVKDSSEIPMNTKGMYNRSVYLDEITIIKYNTPKTMKIDDENTISYEFPEGFKYSTAHGDTPIP